MPAADASDCTAVKQLRRWERNLNGEMHFSMLTLPVAVFIYDLRIERFSNLHEVCFSLFSLFEHNFSGKSLSVSFSQEQEASNLPYGEASFDMGHFLIR